MATEPPVLLLNADLPPRPEWAARPRRLARYLAFVLLFLAGLGAALVLLAPPPAKPAVRLTLPPPLPDPAAILPYLPETARLSNASVPITPPRAPAPAFRFGTADALAEAVHAIARVGPLSGDPYRLADEVGMPPLRIQKAQKQARRWSHARVAEALCLVAALNADVKGAAADPDYALEDAVRKVAEMAARR